MGDPKPITYGRAWELSDEMIPGRTAYVPPETLPPILPATRVRLVVSRRKATKANPSGSVAGLEFLWPDAVLAARGNTPPDEPPGAKTLIKTLASAQVGDEPEIIVSYARGFDINAHGANVRKPIWDEVMVPPTEEDAGGKKRIKIGEHEPQPVDSVTVAGVWRNSEGRAVAFVEGWWLDGSPTGARIWEGKGIQSYGWTPFMARVKEIANEQRKDGLW